ncbi:MAG TPA: hypothetical protein VKT82_28145 [Ktedonobacterales bacterium]|nr:hypothetical protein [Ktedonobacterales bacterium]
MAASSGTPAASPSSNVSGRISRRWLPMLRGARDDAAYAGFAVAAPGSTRQAN